MNGLLNGWKDKISFTSASSSAFISYGDNGNIISTVNVKVNPTGRPTLSGVTTSMDDGQEPSITPVTLSNEEETRITVSSDDEGGEAFQDEKGTYKNYQKHYFTVGEDGWYQCTITDSNGNSVGDSVIGYVYDIMVMLLRCLLLVILEY